MIIVVRNHETKDQYRINSTRVRRKEVQMRTNAG